MGNKTDSPDLALETALLGLNAVFADGGLSETDFEWIRDAVVNLHRAHLAVAAEGRALADSGLREQVTASFASTVNTEQAVLEGDLRDSLTARVEIGGRRIGEILVERTKSMGSGWERYSASVVLGGEEPRGVHFLHKIEDGPLACVRHALEVLEKSAEPREPRTN